MEHAMIFRPTHPDVLELVRRAYEASGDPVQTYADLIALAIVLGPMADIGSPGLAAAILGLEPAKVARHLATYLPVAEAALATRPEIFGRTRAH
ncbi:MAG TPA: hypothetical protein VFR34_04350 [Paracoccaceae bacterium]|nr:hypothetical protein [Paracoccaceae bacterium]